MLRYIKAMKILLKITPYTEYLSPPKATALGFCSRSYILCVCVVFCFVHTAWLVGFSSLTSHWTWPLGSKSGVLTPGLPGLPSRPSPWLTFSPSLSSQLSLYSGCPCCLCLRAMTWGTLAGSVSVARPILRVVEPGCMTTMKLLWICCKYKT